MNGNTYKLSQHNKNQLIGSFLQLEGKYKKFSVIFVWKFLNFEYQIFFYDEKMGKVCCSLILDKKDDKTCNRISL